MKKIEAALGGEFGSDRMSYEYEAQGLVEAACVALSDGQSVTIKIDGEDDWIGVSRINFHHGSASLGEAVCEDSGRTIIFPMVRLVAAAVGRTR